MGGVKGVLKKSAIQEFQATAGLKWVQPLVGEELRCWSHWTAAAGTPPSSSSPPRGYGISSIPIISSSRSTSRWTLPSWWLPWRSDTAPTSADPQCIPR